MYNIVIFASGGGTNAENLMTHYAKSDICNVRAIFCNKPDAFVLKRAENHGIPSFVFSKEELKAPENGNKVLKELDRYSADVILLAGFLPKVPDFLVDRFEGKIINIHPSLIPKYCGKGMYGEHVHEAVVANHETESGITIHLVDKRYDHGRILFQARCSVKPEDTAAEVAGKIHVLEQTYFPDVVINYLKSLSGD
jgi:phosphoribosylglycinamide formyltransferase-1